VADDIYVGFIFLSFIQMHDIFTYIG